MAFNWNNFDPTADEYKDKGFEVIPAGWYPMAISKANVLEEALVTCKNEEKTAMISGPATTLKATVDIIDGQYKGRKIFMDVRLEYPNKKAEGFGKRMFAKLSLALGLRHPKNEGEFLMKPFLGKLKVVPESEQYPAKNDISDIAPINSKPIDKPAPVTVSFPKSDDATATESGEKKYWER